MGSLRFHSLQPSRRLSPSNKFPRLLFACLSAFVFSSAPLFAHSDPIGDIHPKVSIEGGKFFVTAYNSEPPATILRRAYDAAGKLEKEERKSYTKPLPRPYEEYSFISRLPEEQNGLERPWGSSTLIIPEWPRKHAGAPYLIAYTAGAFTYHALKWKHPNIESVVDAHLEGDDLYVLVTRFSPSGDTELWLHRFSLTTFDERAAIQLPNPTYIYTFPGCSNLILYKGHVYIGLITPQTFGYRLVIARWDGSSSTVDLTSLTTKIDWNTDLSLDHIGSRALAAYHYPGAYGGIINGLLGRGLPRASVQVIAFELK